MAASSGSFFLFAFFLVLFLCSDSSPPQTPESPAAGQYPSSYSPGHYTTSPVPQTATTVPTTPSSGPHQISICDLCDCTSVEFFIDCEGRALPNTTMSFPSNLHQIFLGSNALTYLDTNSFPPQPALSILLLNKNLIENISIGTFQVFPGLVKLDLSFNRIQSLNAGVFNGLPSLVNLNLKYNLLTEILPGLFYGLDQLSDLKLSFNRLSVLPFWSFRNLFSLEVAYLEGNMLTRISAFSDLPSLTQIVLSANNLSFLPPETFTNLPKLELIHFWNNQLTRLSEESFLNTSSLKALLLPLNKLTSWPKGLAKRLPALSSLDISYNMLTSFDVEVASTFSNNTQLGLSGNYISFIPPLSAPLKAFAIDFANNPSTCVLQDKWFEKCSCASGFQGNGSYCLPFCAWDWSVLDNGPAQNVVCNTTTSPEYGGMTCSASCGIFPQMSTQFSCSNSGTWVSSAGLAFNISEWQKQCRVFNCGPLEMQEAALKGDEYYLYCPETLSNGTGCSVGCGQGYAGNRSVFQCDPAAERWTGVLPNCSRSTGSGTSDSSASSSSGSSLIVIIIAVVVVSIALVLVGLGAAVLARRRSQARLDPAPDGSRPKEAKGAGDRVESVDALINSPYISSAISSTYAHVFSSASVERTRFMQMEVALEDLEIVGELGEGNYGVVRKGRLRKDGKPFVAVKSVHADAPLMTQQRMILEAMLMCRLVHPHIVGLVGLCSTVNPFLIITEFMAGGGLVDYLRACQAERGAKRRAVLTGRDFIGMSLQVADAMRFLEAKRIVHRDLAARNVLVGSSHEVLKLADFGMARIMVEDDYYRQGSDDAVPLKWMAPESIRNKVYTSASDVWSFGILMWEIASLGQPPYGARAPLEVAKLVFEGRTLNIPQGCPSRLYSHMTQCWEFYEEDRPTFRDLYEGLKTLNIAARTRQDSSNSVDSSSQDNDSITSLVLVSPAYTCHPTPHDLEYTRTGPPRSTEDLPINLEADDDDDGAYSRANRDLEFSTNPAYSQTTLNPGYTRTSRTTHLLLDSSHRTYDNDNNNDEDDEDDDEMETSM